MTIVANHRKHGSDGGERFEIHLDSHVLSTFPGDRAMNSFFFWLTIAAGFGALLATVVRPGALEIVIVVALAYLAFDSYRRIAGRRAVTE